MHYVDSRVLMFFIKIPQIERAEKASFVTYAIAVIMNANLMTIMREKVPIEMQGRVFSAQDTLKNCTIPPGLFLGGILVDYVFEPFMNSVTPLQKLLSLIWDTGVLLKNIEERDT